MPGTGMITTGLSVVWRWILQLARGIEQMITQHTVDAGASGWARFAWAGMRNGHTAR